MKKFALLLLLTFFLFPTKVSAQLTQRLCTESNLQTCLTEDYKNQIFDAALENQIIDSVSGSEVFYNDACPLDRIKVGNVTEEQRNRIYDSCWKLVLPTFTAQLQNSCGVNYNCTVSGPTLETVYKQQFISGLVLYMGAIGISPTQIPNTPTPRPTYFPTPTPALYFGKFDQQLNNTICGTGTGEACCLQTTAFDTQGIPDPTSETGKSGGFFGSIWGKIQSFLPGFMKSGQHIAIKTLNRIQEGQGLCPGDPMLSEIDQPELKPYLWVADEEGNKTDALFTDINEIRKINNLLVEVQSSQTSQAEKDRIWEEELNPALEGKACSCEIPSENDWSKPATRAKNPIAEIRSGETDILGVSDSDRLGALDANNSGITDIINYCNSLDVVTRRERFQNSNVLTCQATMANTVHTAKKVCSPIKNVPEYDEKEYEACFDCVVKDDGVWTALGCFYSDFSRTLNERIFGLAVSIAGIVALGCIIYAAFMMQTSAGNPERTGKAQELMTACITGLIVIIFSIFILRVIGVDILRLPGFVGPTPTPTPASDGVCTYIGDPDCAVLTPSP